MTTGTDDSAKATTVEPVLGTRKVDIDADTYADAEPDPEPHRRRIQRNDVLCVGPILASYIYGIVGRPLLPLLIATQPLLLSIIRPSMPALIAVGAVVHAGGIPLWLAIMVPLPMLLFPDPCYFWAGRRYGPAFTKALIAKDKGWEKRIAKAERVMSRFGAWAILMCNIPYNPLPGTAVFFIAGTTRMRWRWFLLADFVGSTLFAAGSIWLGYKIGDQASRVLDKLGEYDGYLFWLTLIAVAILIVIKLRKAIREVRAQAFDATSVVEPRRPMQGADVLCMAPIILSSAWELFGRGIAASVTAAKPVLLVSIRTSLPVLIATGALVRSGGIPLWVALAAPLPYLFFADPFFVWAGRRYGDTIARHYKRRGTDWSARVDRIETFVRRWGSWSIVACGVPVVPIPVTILCFAAGQARIPIVRIVIADIVSKLIFVGSTLSLGYALGNQAQPTVDAITGAGGRVLAAGMILALLYLLLIVRRRVQRNRDRLAAAGGGSMGG